MIKLRTVCAATIALGIASACASAMAQGALSAQTLKNFTAQVKAVATIKASETTNKIGVNVIPTLVPNDTVIPFIGGDVPKVTVVEDGKPVEKFWTELKPEVWNSLLSNLYTETNVYVSDKNGNFSYVPFSTSIGKKRYRIVYNNFVYKSYPCSTKDPRAGELLVGVGLRITAVITSKSENVGITLPALALGASNKTVEGNILGRVIGLASSKTLTQNVSKDQQAATFESLIAATGAIKIADAVLENKNLTSTPQIIGYVDAKSPGSCFAAMDEALK